ncbi:MAG: agmatine deiminase family protein [Flavobacteriales bacterium]
MRSIALLFLTFLTLNSFAQEDILPIWMTKEEEKLIPAYKESLSHKEITVPPVGSEIRTPGQWEEVQAVCITWTSYPSIHRQLVNAIQQECEVWIVCSDSNAVKTDITNNGGSLNNTRYFQLPFNSIWMRDYGPNSVYLGGVDSLAFVDWIYNRPRPFDNDSPIGIGAQMNIPTYTMATAPNDLVHTGGNFMADGFGTGFSSNLVNEENATGATYTISGHTPFEVNQLMNDYQGINNYIKMTNLPYDGIHHIDMHMKLLNEETLLIGEFPSGVSDGPQIEQNIQFIQDNYVSAFGTPYKIVRVPMPPSASGAYAPTGSYRTYTNNVIVNKSVIVPTYRTEYDTTALRIIQEAMPGYNVIGIDVDNSGSNLIAQGGALHCITKEVASSDPLLISHQNLSDTWETIIPYVVNAQIRHKSGIASATLYYKTSLTGTYTSVPMTFVSGNVFTASIPGQAAGTRIYYYIQAQANSGKQQVRPMPAPDGYFSFLVYQQAGIEDPFTVSFGKVYPNPTNGNTSISLTSSATSNGAVDLIDATGRCIQIIYSGVINKGINTFQLDAGQIDPGVYFIRLKLSEKNVTQKLIIR